jgi:hypothetical protein
MISIDDIPPDIVGARRWLVWRWEKRNGKQTKPPYQASAPDVPASSTDPQTWSSVENALGAVEHGRADGIGIALGDGLAGMDLDGCREPETEVIAPWAIEIIQAIDSYTEVSPSGTGVKIFLRGTLPAGSTRRRKGAIEMYDSERYFTVTGEHLAGMPTTLEERTAEFAALYVRIFGVDGKSERCKPQSSGGATSRLADDELLRLAHDAANGPKFTALWKCDLSGYTSQSEADAALCSILAFWSGCDRAQMDRLFRRSALMREKWDEKRGGGTYGSITIGNAIVNCGEVYSGKGAYDDDGAVETEVELERPEPEPEPFAIITPRESFVTKYVEHVRKRTDAPEQAHELKAFAILSVLVGPALRIPLAISNTGLRLILWTCYIVNSTEGRKTTVVNFALDLLTAVLGERAILSWEGSPQGIIQRLQERDGLATAFIRDEYSGLLEQMHRGGHMAGLQEVFIRAYDGRIIENVRTRKRNKNTGELHDDIDRALNPYLVKIMGTVRDAFVSRADIGDIVSGFLARFVFVTGTAHPRPVTRTTDQMRDEWEDLVAHARDFHQRAQRITSIDVSDAVLEAHWHLEQAWAARARASNHPQAAGPALKRLADAVLTCAALLAIDDCKLALNGSYIARLKLDHFKTAQKIGEARWISATLGVIDDLGATTFQRDCDAVAATVAANPTGITLGDLYRAHRRLKKRDFDEITAALLVQERIRRAEMPGTKKGPQPIGFKPGRASKGKP